MFRKYKDDETGNVREGIEVAHDPGESADPVLSGLSAGVSVVTLGIVNLPVQSRDEHGTYQDRETGQLRAGKRA